jgi:hypothetical protein
VGDGSSDFRDRAIALTGRYTGIHELTPMANEGIGNDLRKAFIVYVINHNRPTAGVLARSRLNISKEFARGLAGLIGSNSHL